MFSEYPSFLLPFSPPISDYYKYFPSLSWQKNSRVWQIAKLINKPRAYYARGNGLLSHFKLNMIYDHVYNFLLILELNGNLFSQKNKLIIVNTMVSTLILENKGITTLACSAAALVHEHLKSLHIFWFENKAFRLVVRSSFVFTSGNCDWLK